jgi:uncharacterized protein YdaU (DUF1376 family)
MKRPWFPFYVGDYMRDTSRLNTEAHGAYLLLIIDYWVNGPPPDDDDVLANITKLAPKAWKKQRALLAAFFEIKDGRWQHRRIDQEIAKAIEIGSSNSDKARTAAELRWAKERERKQQEQPEQCSSDAPSMDGAMLQNAHSQSPSLKKDIAHPEDAPPTDSGNEKRASNTALTLAIAQGFEKWWRLCPLKKSKIASRKAYERTVRSGAATIEELEAGMKRYHLECLGKDPKFIKHPSTWLNGGCWSDEPTPSAISHAGLHLPGGPDWDAMMRQYLAAPAHSRIWYGQGPEPGQPDCQVPPDVLSKHGFGPPAPPTPPIEDRP